MNLGISFFVTSIMLGAGLAMDVFSVSLANGLNEPTMKKAGTKLAGKAGILGGVILILIGLEIFITGIL